MQLDTHIVSRQTYNESHKQTVMYTYINKLMLVLLHLQANVPQEVTLDPEEARKRAIEAEEARLAAARAHGTHVTPETFTQWRKRFDTELALQKARYVFAELACGS